MATSALRVVRTRAPPVIPQAPLPLTSPASDGASKVPNRPSSSRSADTDC
ncbi:hypothetical protein HQO42_25560 [Rhodococcus fascians]|nr:hypothetical protein [Rhodococcus fascians]MBY4240362.1 hypothetical protein [Rhodococcus fascians]MBY4256029.1 hypothetical protein [Rhodococcus fascians]MBY4271816.1 hypothetical protein [Rhodococcus fascians]